MKQISKGYSLIESLIVLGLVSIMLLLGSSPNQPTTDINNQNMWEETFKSQWQQSRLQAQMHQDKIIIKFKHDRVCFKQTTLQYPKGYVMLATKNINILSTGYVAPTTVTLIKGKKKIKIIFSFGGGVYRIEKT